MAIFKKGKHVTGILLPLFNGKDPDCDELITTGPNNKWKWAKNITKLHVYRLGPDDKKEPVHKYPETRNTLVNIFPEAIAIGAPAGGPRWVMGVMGVIFFPLVIMFYYISFMFTTGGIGFFLFSLIILFPISTLMMVVVIWFFRIWLCMVKDYPTVFNRKDRTVTYSTVEMPNPLRFWKFSASLNFKTVAWDSVKVRTRRWLTVQPGAVAAHDSFRLCLIWLGEGEQARSAVDFVDIGTTAVVDDTELWMIWEHIRRYMEDGGPAIQPGESPRKLGAGRKIVYPSEVIEAAGGPPLSLMQVCDLAGEEVIQ